MYITIYRIVLGPFSRIYPSHYQALNLLPLSEMGGLASPILRDGC